MEAVRERVQAAAPERERVSAETRPRQAQGGVIEVAGLTKRYGDLVAVDGISFQVEGGEIFGLLGPNGAGKTTTIRMIMGIYGADAGAVRVLGGQPKEMRERVGYLPEDRGLYQNDRVINVLTYMAELKGVARSEGRERAQQWLERVGLGERARDRVKDYSRGMRQKVQIIMCLLHEPELLILDEPFQGLDPVNVRQVRELIRSLADAGTTIVLSSHQLGLVEALCDRMALISEGRIVEYGRLDAIRRRHSPVAVYIETPAPLPRLLQDLGNVVADGSGYHVELHEVTPQTVLRRLVAEEVAVEKFERATASLEDVFVNAVSGVRSDG